MKLYLNHPVLVNPTRYLKVPCYQSPTEYKQLPYTKSINCNPFVKNLLTTNASNLTHRFPNGSLIKIITESNNGKYQMIPTIDTIIDHSKLTAPSYIINNKKYLKLVDDRKMWKSHLSNKYKTHNSDRIVKNTNARPNFIQHYQQLLEDRINQILNSGNKNDNISEWIILTNNGPLYTINNDKIIINLPNINYEGTIDNNEVLSHDILKLMMFHI